MSSHPMRRLASNRLSLIFDKCEWNNYFIIYTRSEFTDLAFLIFSVDSGYSHEMRRLVCFLFLKQGT